MSRYDYAYGVAYIRAVENRLLTNTDIENLIAAKTADEAIRIPADRYSLEPIPPRNFEELLKKEADKAWEDVNYALPKGATLDFLLYKNDFHNLKVAIKAVMTGIRNCDKYVVGPSTVSFDKIMDAAVKKDFSLLDNMLSHVAMTAYDVLSRTKDSQLSDTIIDKASMDFSLDSALKTKNSFLIGYVKLLNTIADIKIAVRSSETLKTSDYMDMAFSKASYLSRESLIRASLAGIEELSEYLAFAGYGEAANAIKISMQDYEKISDNLITEYMKNSSGVSFGVEPLVSYIVRKQTEILNVRIIMSAKLNGFSEEDIRERLRSI